MQYSEDFTYEKLQFFQSDHMSVPLLLFYEVPVIAAKPQNRSRTKKVIEKKVLGNTSERITLSFVGISLRFPKWPQVLLGVLVIGQPYNSV